MNLAGILLIIIGIIIAVALYQNGFQGLKEKPLDSTIQSTKTIGEGIKYTYEQGKGLITKKETNEIGKIPCAINADCNLIKECQENLCLCNAEKGICYKEVNQSG